MSIAIYHLMLDEAFKRKFTVCYEYLNARRLVLQFYDSRGIICSMLYLWMYKKIQNLSFLLLNLRKPTAMNENSFIIKLYTDS